MNPIGSNGKSKHPRDREGLRGVRNLLWALGILLIGYATYVYVETMVFQSTEQSKFESTVEKSWQQFKAHSWRSTPREFTEGETIGEFQVARLKMNLIFVQGDKLEVFNDAISHLPTTALPGHVGNVVLAGHRDGLFNPLKNIKVGDEITLKTNDGRYDYMVDAIDIVDPDQVEYLAPSSGRMLTLVTCYPFHYIGPAPKRFIVQAHQMLTDSAYGSSD